MAFLQQLKRRPLILVAGSVWEQDAKLLFESIHFLKSFYQIKVSLICVPHEVNKKTCHFLEKTCQNYDLTFSSVFSLSSETNSFSSLKDSDVIILNQIGILAEVYALGDLTYVGGAMHHRVHNVLEPLAYAKPSCFGPRYKTSLEAVMLVKNNLAEVVHSSSEIANWCSYHYDARFRSRKALASYLKARTGATRRVLEYLKSY